MIATEMETSKTRRRWFRFRLRTLLVLVTVLTVPLGWVGWEMDQRRREKEVGAWIEGMGGEVNSYSLLYSLMDERNWWEKKKDKWFGERVRDVDFSPSPYEVHSLDISPLQVGDLSPLAELKNLEFLDFRNTLVNEEQVDKLRLALPNCKIDF